MSNQDDFEKHAAAIEAIDKKVVKHPNMPAGIYFQEGEDLYAWANDDRAALLAAGLSEAFIDELSGRIGAARYIQSRWNSKRFTKEDAQKKFAVLAPVAYDLRDTLVHDMLYAYRRHPDLKSRVQAIADGSGDSDMIQDLSDLGVHGKNNPEPLAAVNFDMSKLNEAAAKSDELGSLLGVAHGEKAVDKETKILRDKAYTFLKESVDEIRDCGQYVFWRNEERSVGYASAHFRRTRGKRDSTPTETEIIDAP